MRIYWTSNAEKHLEAIAAYIGLNSPEQALRVIQRLTDRMEQVAQFPLSGRIVRKFDTDQIREVIEGTYRIIYYIAPDQIQVLAVLHAARNVLLPDEEGQ